MKFFVTLLFSMLMKFSLAEVYLEKSVPGAVQRLNSVKPGDTVLLASGIYKDETVKFTSTGTKEKLVVFMAQVSGGVFFEGNSTLSFAGSYIIIDGFVWRNGGNNLEKKSVIEFRRGGQELADHCVLQNCMIDSYNNADKNIDNKWVSVYGQYNTVKSCLLKSKDNLGATLTVWLKEGVEASHTIEYNFLFKPHKWPKCR